jgi:hypothetical protein
MEAREGGDAFGSVYNSPTELQARGRPLITCRGRLGCACFIVVMMVMPSLML